MTQFSTSESFLIRVYRVDTEDYRKINGLVEAMDGGFSGDNTRHAGYRGYDTGGNEQGLTVKGLSMNDSGE